MQAANALFLKIWGNVMGKALDINTKENVKDCFPEPSRAILDIWLKNGLGKQFIAKVERSIGSSVSKENGHLLIEALIQTSFYHGNSLKPGQHVPNYERLEFLGDSVLGLVITEILWLEYPHDNPSTALDHLVTAKISGNAQAKVFSKLGLGKFVQRNAGSTSGWSMHDDIVESVVGAIFVDGGGIAAKDFIVKTWDLQVTTKEPNLDDIEEKLGYKFRNNKFLMRALSHPKSNGIPNIPSASDEINERSKKLREVLKYFGQSWIQFHATEYVLRASSQEDSVAALVFRRNSLCTEQTMLRIGSCLNLSAYITLSSNQRNRGVEPYMLYEDIIHSIAGAVFKDMQEAGIRMSFGKVFYRLWNPFLKTYPKGSILDIFHSQDSAQAFRDWQLQEIGGNIRHVFSNRHLLEQAISELSRLGMFRNNPRKLSLIGESTLNLAVRVYVTILCHMHLDNPENSPRDLDFRSIHAHTLSQCLDLAEILYELEVIREHSEHATGASQQGNGESDEELTKRIFGAIFVDLSGRDADLSFSKWKQYFMIRCEFISGNSREE